MPQDGAKRMPTPCIMLTTSYMKKSMKLPFKTDHYCPIVGTAVEVLDKKMTAVSFKKSAYFSISHKKFSKQSDEVYNCSNG